jgi:hypothetical protein
MRTPTTQESNLAALGDYVVCIKLEIDRSGSGDYQDLTDFLGFDWVKSVQYGENIDDPVAAFTAVLAAEIGDYKLSPFVERSLLNQWSGGYTPALALGRRIKLYTATIPHMSMPTSADWRLVFDGYVDEVDPVTSEDEITVRARNQGAVVQDLFIETTQVYGADTSPFEAVEDVMQDILDDNIGGSAPTLYVPSSPSWNIMRYAQQREPVLSALRALAAQIGWDVRYKWRSGTGQFELTFSDIDRTKSTPDKTYAPGQVLDYSQMSMKMADIRNAVRVVYTPLSTQVRTSVLVTDSTSISNYGRRYFEAAEASSSNVDTSTEANLMANAILADLKDPSVNSSVTVPYSYELELGDLLRLEADHRHFDSDIDGAVVSYQNTIGPRGAKSVLQLRGKPAGKFLGWLRMEARGGVAPIGGIDRPDAATSGAVVQTPTGLQITYDDPTASGDLTWKDWSHSECHVSSTSGFTPSVATLFAQGKTTKFTISGLAPRTTYYIKIIVVDVYGNRSLASSQQVETLPQFAPAAINNEQTSQLIPNAEFAIQDPGEDIANMPPSGWVAFDYVSGDEDPDNSEGWWGSGGEIYYEDSATITGDKVITIDNHSSRWPGLITADYMPIEGGKNYLDIMCRAYNASSPASNLIYGAKFYDKDRAYDSVHMYAQTTYGSWTMARLRTGFIPPSTARYVRFFVANGGGSGGHTTKVDALYARRLPYAFAALKDSITPTSGSTVVSGFDDSTNPYYDHGAVFDGQTFTVPDDGAYSFAAQAYSVSTGSAAFYWYIELLLNGTTVIARSTPSERTSSASIRSDLSVVLPHRALSEGDYVEARVYHNHSSSWPINSIVFTARKLEGY